MAINRMTTCALLPFVLTSHLNFEHTYVHNGVEQFCFALVALVQLAFAPIFIVSSALWTFCLFAKEFLLCASVASTATQSACNNVYAHSQSMRVVSSILFARNFVCILFRSGLGLIPGAEIDEDKRCVHVIAHRRNPTHECIGRCCCLPARRQPHIR